MDDHLEFKAKGAAEIEKQGQDQALKKRGMDWLVQAAETSYSHHFEWLGRPIIQLPQDIVGTQQILWKVQPDLIIETGIAHWMTFYFCPVMISYINIDPQHFSFAN